MMYVVENGVIVDSWYAENAKDCERIRRALLKDGQTLEAAGDLETRQIYEYLDDVNSWDDRLVPGLMEEMCDRLGLDSRDYEDYDALYDAITGKLVEA